MTAETASRQHIIFLIRLFLLGCIHFDLTGIFSESHESSTGVLYQHDGSKGKADARHQARHGKTRRLAHDKAITPATERSTDPRHVIGKARRTKTVVDAGTGLDGGIRQRRGGHDDCLLVVSKVKIKRKNLCKYTPRTSEKTDSIMQLFLRQYHQKGTAEKGQSRLPRETKIQRQLAAKIGKTERRTSHETALLSASQTDPICCDSEIFPSQRFLHTTKTYKING